MKKPKCTLFMAALGILLLGLVVSCMMKRKEGFPSEYNPLGYNEFSNNSQSGNISDNSGPTSDPKSNYTRSPDWSGETKRPKSNKKPRHTQIPD